MKNKFEAFLSLHQQAEPLIIGNAWNVQSAKVFEQKNFKAIATSSLSVAETLGYEDGQDMNFEDYLFVVKRIAASVSLPFSVDLEGGYGDTTEQIVGNIIQLYHLGVSGINIEDSVVVNGQRSIENAEIFAEKLRRICALLNAENIKIFINVRSDSFLLGLPNALEDALSRINLYQNTGVHGLFFPCITQIPDMQQVTQSSKLPINVMCVPGLPNFEQLQQAGIKRISIGPFLNKSVYQKMGATIDQMVEEGSFDNLF
ncbi:isocitrate lyase/PEP mutase family protein [Mucilaginibacter lappiensis]|uniref:2-methylisocitrate lyase-like PEP mutase family enzyme n=1 Tax=Mucilaginibacter lappiensis TaxID=354630 RepID=A0A1N6V1Q4_9SPHI|nr:isocitrate lyase/phosphoenolpyruvate mutase family protein [Mucilaginibacter lappiensis]MBB6109011.1 2-methylisocitrate lyase-like PEP mutase family enzyme [Mucilaginibacter lappiensis]MBB6127393.1 2-methylisocitrate lyase-like PEP mutase family enzyme [Mucilaginibacter lappiensis]SIQ71843.1 2-Methylisocitrate lyase, PEP mutase family [Mucilaginibacter lappiensis]